MNTKILALGLLSLALGASGCRNTGKQATQLQSVGIAVPRAVRITIDKLPEILRNVQAGRTQFDFTGICGNGTDCIYFVLENGKFYIDFEAMGKDQLPYIDTLKQFAKEHNYPVVETTYNKYSGRLRTSEICTCYQPESSCRHRQYREGRKPD